MDNLLVKIAISDWIFWLEIENNASQFSAGSQINSFTSFPTIDLFRQDSISQFPESPPISQSAPILRTFLRWPERGNMCQVIPLTFKKNNRMWFYHCIPLQCLFTETYTNTVFGSMSCIKVALQKYCASYHLESIPVHPSPPNTRHEYINSHFHSRILGDGSNSSLMRPQIRVCIKNIYIIYTYIYTYIYIYLNRNI